MGDTSRKMEERIRAFLAKGRAYAKMQRRKEHGPRRHHEGGCRTGGCRVATG